MTNKLVLILLILAGCSASQKPEMIAGAPQQQGSIYQPLVTFNTGHLSPHMEARNDFEKYRASCRQLENMVVTVQGPASKRPGTEYIATSAETQDVSRLISFLFSTDDTYILEFIDDKMYVYRNGAQVAAP